MLKCFCEDPLTLEPGAEHWYATKCGHIFHYLCLINWLERSKTCPQCRDPVGTGQMFRLFPSAWEDTPNDDINETLQKCLNETQSQLVEMTALCKKKDAVILSLKVDVDNDNNYRRENLAFKSLLQTFNGETLNQLFDDPNHLDKVLKGKMALIKLDERSQASKTDAAVAQQQMEAPNASVMNSTTDEESETLESWLETLNNMLTRLSQI